MLMMLITWVLSVLTVIVIILFHIHDHIYCLPQPAGVGLVGKPIRQLKLKHRRIKKFVQMHIASE